MHGTPIILATTDRCIAGLSTTGTSSGDHNREVPLTVTTIDMWVPLYQPRSHLQDVELAAYSSSLAHPQAPHPAFHHYDNNTKVVSHSVTVVNLSSFPAVS